MPRSGEAHERRGLGKASRLAIGRTLEGKNPTEVTRRKLAQGRRERRGLLVRVKRPEAATYVAVQVLVLGSDVGATACGPTEAETLRYLAKAGEASKGKTPRVR
jgi:hypothetical protein